MKRRNIINTVGIAASSAIAASILSPPLDLSISKARATEQTKKRPGETAGCNPKLIDRLLGAIENEIVPLTQQGVRQGNKLFGAGMLKKSDLSTIIMETNHETLNPLFHGEVYTINKYYELPKSDHVDPKNVIFIATHEPCTLCSSAITWAGFDNFYYLFSHEDSRDSFNIGHDLKILKEVFKIDPGEYARSNAYWNGYSIVDLVNNCEEKTKQDFLDRIEKLKITYAEMSDIYQKSKGQSDDPAYIPLN